MISCFGALNGWTLLQGQIPYGAAKDGVFPEIFAKKSRYGTPITGLVVSSFIDHITLGINIAFRIGETVYPDYFISDTRFTDCLFYHLFCRARGVYQKCVKN